MFALVWVDEHSKMASIGWVPLGRFVRKYSLLSPGGQPIGKTIADEVERGENWSPLRAGLFGGSTERLQSAKQRVDSFIAGASQW